MANLFGKVTVRITWQHIQVWRSIMSGHYRLQDRVEPVEFTLEDLQGCLTAHEMLNFMGAMGWECFQVLISEEEVFNYFFKRPIITEEGQPGPVRVKDSKDSIINDFEIMKLMGGD